MERQGAKPLYQVVAEALLAQTASGELQANDRLPSEHELCEIYGVGRNTVRRAINEMVSRGVLKTVPGVGTFVVEARYDKTAEFLFGFSQEMGLHGKAVTSEVLEAKIIPADPFLSRRLHVQLGAEVVFLNRLRLMDGEPIAIERAYLPHHLCRGILKHDFSVCSLYETLANEYGKQPFSADQEIEASLATPEVARLLGLEQPAVVLVFHRETRLADNQVIEYVDSELRGDRFRFYTTLRSQQTLDDTEFRRMPILFEVPPAS